MWCVCAYLLQRGQLLCKCVSALLQLIVCVELVTRQLESTVQHQHQLLQVLWHGHMLMAVWGGGEGREEEGRGRGERGGRERGGGSE